MSRTAFSAAASAVIVGFLLLATLPFPLTNADSPMVPFVVGFHQLPNERNEYAGGHVKQVDEDLQTMLVETKNPRGLLERASHDPKVSFVEEDADLYSFDGDMNDPYYATYQYDLQPATTNIHAAWSKTRGSTDVKVCVVDTGQYRKHADFVGVTWGEWKDFVNGVSGAYDDNGHGTHVTGTIGAIMDNDRGIAGIAKVTIAGAKVLNSTGRGYTSVVANAITWCTNIGSDIINLSLGGSSTNTLANAVNYAASKGVLLVASVGNKGPCTDCVRFPAAYPSVLAVACTDTANAQCKFSSEGPEVDVAAPGVSIWSTVPSACGGNNCYARKSGTSMSAPHVTGLAALIKSEHPDLTPQEIRDRIRGTALDLGAVGFDSEFGAGIIRGSAV